MALPTGLAGQWTAPVAEATYGVAQSLAGTPWVAAESDSMKLNPMFAQGTGIFAGKLYGRGARRVTNGWSAGGAIPFELPAQHLQQWLFPMFGSYGQTNATLTQIATSGVYKAVHVPGDLTGHSFTLQKGVPGIDGTVVPVTYVGCKITDWTIDAQLNAIAKLTATIEARNELAGSTNGDPLNGASPSLGTWALPAGGVFTFLQGSVLLGGTVSTTSGITSVSGATAAGNIKSIQVKHAVPLDLQRYALGQAGFRNEPLQNGLRGGSGQYVVEWISSGVAMTAYNNFAAQTPTAIQLTFTGPIVGTSGTNHSLLALILPLTYYDGDSPQIPGPGVVTTTVPFTYLDDDVNNVIQATYQTVDVT